MTSYLQAVVIRFNLSTFQTAFRHGQSNSQSLPVPRDQEGRRRGPLHARLPDDRGHHAGLQPHRSHSLSRLRRVFGASIGIKNSGKITLNKLSNSHFYVAQYVGK
jgi:hypothetical protein